MSTSDEKLSELLELQRKTVDLLARVLERLESSEDRSRAKRTTVSQIAVGTGPRVIRGPIGHKRVKCEHCLVTVEYAPNDVKTVNGRDYSGGPDGHDYLTCPGCKKKIILDSW